MGWSRAKRNANVVRGLGGNAARETLELFDTARPCPDINNCKTCVVLVYYVVLKVSPLVLAACRR